MMRVLVCGGRDYENQAAVFAELDRLHEGHGVSRVIHGGACGADAFAGHWAVRRGVPSSIYAAQWRKYGNAAGPMRNAQMLAEGKPDLVLAFPGGRGTANMVMQARRADVRTVEVA